MRGEISSCNVLKALLLIEVNVAIYYIEQFASNRMLKRNEEGRGGKEMIKIRKEC